MTSRDLFRGFVSEGSCANYEWAMSAWSPADPLHIPAIQSNFGDLTSWEGHWPTKESSCSTVTSHITSIYNFSPH
jgi:hypothetical protein